MKNVNQSTLLKLFKILYRKTDENHQLSMNEILQLLEEEACTSSEDSVHRYICQLQNELDIDIVSGRGRSAKYFLGTRLLQNEELKLIVDAINASNFIGADAAKSMIARIKELCSVYDAQELERSVLGITVAKSENKKILYCVNEIQVACRENRQIAFEYKKWNKYKKLVDKSSKRYVLSPWALIWAYDRYYLLGYEEDLQTGELKEKLYRVDKIDNVRVLEQSRKGKKQFQKFDANTFVARRIGMFHGTETEVTVEIPERLIGAFIDQFGKSIIVREVSEEMLQITFQTVPSYNFFGWLIGLTEAKLVGPRSAVEKMRELVEKNYGYYKQ